MKLFSSEEIAFTGIISIIGGFLSEALGGWSSDLTTLVIFMSIDYIMGLIIAAVYRKSGKSESGALSSNAGWKGLFKKCMILSFVLIAHRLDLIIGADYIRTAVIIGFSANELVSIVENAGIMGIPLPSVIVKAIDLLKNKDKNN